MKVVIYDLDGVSIYAGLTPAIPKIKELYGEKLAAEVCTRLSRGRLGMVYRRYGGPRIELVSDTDAERIRAKEQGLILRT